MPNANAWSSKASRTDAKIQNVAAALEAYRERTGHLPESRGYWRELLKANVWDLGELGQPVDDWGHALIYRAPGRHGDFDLYSCGADGMDTDGAFDDVSNWAGVNDGYHWKATWPMGRLAIAAGVALGLLCLLLARLYPWKFVAPVAGAVVCLGVVLGCHWLMHPGIAPSRNGLLALSGLVAAGSLAALAAYLIVNIRRAGLPIRCS